MPKTKTVKNKEGRERVRVSYGMPKMRRGRGVDTIIIIITCPVSYFGPVVLFSLNGAFHIFGSVQAKRKTDSVSKHHQACQVMTLFDYGDNLFV